VSVTDDMRLRITMVPTRAEHAAISSRYRTVFTASRIDRASPALRPHSSASL
jgi:hypothetical protein